MEYARGINDQDVRYRFGKRDRLRHKIMVDGLFEKGSNIFRHPLRMIWRVEDTSQLGESFKTGMPPRVGDVQIMITVPKKKRRHAVDRVLNRRRIREAVRLRALPALHDWCSRNPGRSILLAFIYIHNENASYDDISGAVDKLMEKLWKTIEPASPQDCGGS